MKSHILLLIILLATASFVSAHVGDAGSNKHAENMASFPLMHTAYHGDLAGVKRLLDNGAEVNQPSKNGFTALIRAAGKGHAEVAKVLLGNGVEVNQADEKGRTALIQAVNGVWRNAERTEIAKLLLRHGANPDTRDATGNNIWNYVSDDKSVEYLLRKALKNNRVE